MNEMNSTGIRIKRRDYCRLPDDMRAMSDSGPLVMTSLNGSRTFVQAIIID